jgi:hypothetical protein
MNVKITILNKNLGNMGLENNQKQGNSGLLELPPTYSEVEVLSRVPNYQNNRNGVSNCSANDGRNVNENSTRSADKDCHPASFLFGIPIIGLIARIAVGLDHSFRGYHHRNHRHSHHHSHHHGFNMNALNNQHHHHSSHMNPFGY